MTRTVAARTVRDGLVCGRQAAGRYVCQGELGAYVRLDPPVGGRHPQRLVVQLEIGFTEDPPESHRWRRTARAQSMLLDGRRARGGPRVRGGARSRPHGQRRPEEIDFTLYAAALLAAVKPPLPWYLACPHCGVLNEVNEPDQPRTIDSE